MKEYIISFNSKSKIGKDDIYKTLQNYSKKYLFNDLAIDVTPVYTSHFLKTYLNLSDADLKPNSNTFVIHIRRIDYSIICDLDHELDDKTILNFRIPLYRPRYYHSESGRLLQFIVSSLNLQSGKKFKSKNLIKNLFDCRLKLPLDNVNFINDSSLLDKFIEYQRTWNKIVSKYGHKSFVIPSTTYISLKNERRTFIAAICPKPTMILFPPVDYFILFKNPEGLSSNPLPKGLLNAPVISYRDVINPLRPFLKKLPECPAALLLSEKSLMVNDFPDSYNKFEELWNLKSKFQKFKEFEKIYNEPIID